MHSHRLVWMHTLKFITYIVTGLDVSGPLLIFCGIFIKLSCKLLKHPSTVGLASFCGGHQTRPMWCLHTSVMSEATPINGWGFIKFCHGRGFWCHTLMLGWMSSEIPLKTSGKYITTIKISVFRSVSAVLMHPSLKIDETTGLTHLSSSLSLCFSQCSLAFLKGQVCRAQEKIVSDLNAQVLLKYVYKKIL